MRTYKGGEKTEIAVKHRGKTVVPQDGETQSSLLTCVSEGWKRANQYQEQLNRKWRTEGKREKGKEDKIEIQLEITKTKTKTFPDTLGPAEGRG